MLSMGGLIYGVVFFESGVCYTGSLALPELHSENILPPLRGLVGYVFP